MASGNTWKTRCPIFFLFSAGSTVVQGINSCFLEGSLYICSYLYIYIYIWFYTYNLVHDIFTNIYPHSFLQISKAYTGIDIHLLGFLLASSFSHRQFEDAMTEAPSYQSLNLLPRHMTQLDPQFQVAVDVVRSATKSNVTCRTFRFFRQICARVFSMWLEWNIFTYILM